MKQKQTILTGIKCTGVPHIGNYLGAIKPAIEKANASDTQSFFFLADYHALNQIKDPKELAQSVKEIACTWLACGLDPKKTVFYRQSDIPEVFELSTILGNVTAKGLMNRAHSYKAAVQANLEHGRDADDEINIGLFTYPILQAADIILMDTNFVPVGADQKQHIEMAGDIAKSFNAIYGKVLVVPKEIIKDDVGTIQGLDGRKMSKSYGNTIPLFCTEEELLKHIKRIATDSSSPIDEKPTSHLIFQLYKHFTGADLETKIGWGTAKEKLFHAMNAVITPMREKFNYLMANFNEVEKILNDGAKSARQTATATINRVRKAIGVG